ncbi:DUF2971 domain-containing protein [Cryobacterium serini]|uniref:DUF2971 domain-containing protein n=1 Tax=Cryobacterium serini TaxID=1259201 RepID=A0A4R9BTH3_9MICO|nr:DUF2971 domain-containing protein [Cryobacterium serini]TFD90387.1 DUF2971 domain-containing protein [Cryobacterium serini]
MISGDEVGDFLEQELAAAPRLLTPNLYHYTSSDAAILGILANRTIRMSPFAGTNDLWESRPLRPNLEGKLPRGESSEQDVFSIWEDIDRYIRGHSKVACFTQDWELPGSVMQPDALRGWSHLSLWAHYGASHAGVCLRFDRDRLVAAFEAAQGNAVHQFYGPVRYRGAEFGVGPHGISLAQAAEFGLDAVALQYANVHRDRVFFRKHADWASESEFRLVRTDLSIEPHYFDISEALTGVVLGETFPNDRIPALLVMLAGFDDVEVLRATFHNRTLQLFRRETHAESESAPRPMSVTASTIPPRRSGDLTQRLASLEAAERIAHIDREAAMQAAAPLLRIWHEGLADQPELYATWPGVVFNSYPQATAIPPEDRRNRAGVPGEVIAYEAGHMVVAEHQPQYSFTCVMAIALQIMPNGAGRLHSCITTEEWASGGNKRQELYRDRRDTNLDEVLETSSQVLASLIEAIPDARSKFDELRGERTGS